jgi:hypothetical protein
MMPVFQMWFGHFDVDDVDRLLAMTKNEVKAIYCQGMYKGRI